MSEDLSQGTWCEQPRELPGSALCQRCDHTKSYHPDGGCEANLCGCWDFEASDEPPISSLLESLGQSHAQQIADLLAERDATIRELRAELAEHDKRWQGRADLITQTGDLRRRAAELEEQIDEMTHRWGRLVAAEQDRASDALAERDRARDLAAHLRGLLALFVDDEPHRFDHNGWCQNHTLDEEKPGACSMDAVRAALAAHLEAEQAETRDE